MPHDRAAPKTPIRTSRADPAHGLHAYCAGIDYSAAGDGNLRLFMDRSWDRVSLVAFTRNKPHRVVALAAASDPLLVAAARRNKCSWASSRLGSLTTQSMLGLFGR